MIRPIGGELWQWDTGRTVEVRAKPGCTVDEVHFHNGTTESALLGLVDIVDNVVTSDIPNIFLQSANNLVVYSVMVDEKGNRTTESATFAVHKREKPDDYVYTETEILSWDSFNKRIATLESEPPCGVTYIHSPDADKNYTFLRDLESGTYILDGTFIAYSVPEGSTKFVSFSYGFPVVIGRTDEKTYLQCLYPPYNTVQYAEITDDSFIRNDKKMQYMPDITVSGMPGQIMEVYKVDDRNIPVEWKLIDQPVGSISGSGKPNTSTEGKVGQIYMDTATGETYKCTAVTETETGFSYTWYSLLPATVPNIKTAAIGQAVMVKAVDENGAPTDWEAVDMPVLTYEDWTFTLEDGSIVTKKIAIKDE